MSTSNRTRIYILATMLALLIQTSVLAQDTAFNYQGQLRQTGEPFTGLADLEFVLYDALTDGSEIGLAQSLTGVPIEDGLFSVELDFGEGAFDGSERYLQIRVDGDVLNPRQRMTATPYSLLANRVASGALSGTNNEASGDDSTVSGGASNTASGEDSSIGGGFANEASGRRSTVCGGIGNEASGTSSLACGGEFNTASNTRSTVTGGRFNTASGLNSTIGGGINNEASSSNTVIAGGQDNTASGFFSTVSGGAENTASADRSTVSGGSSNHASGSESSIGGGSGNQTFGAYSNISGGSSNRTIASFNNISGGRNNRTSNAHSTVGGGLSNYASGLNSAVGGGSENTASAQNSTVSGGAENCAAGRYSWAGGFQAKVRRGSASGLNGFGCLGIPTNSTNVFGDEGTFVWADSQGNNFVSTGSDQFLIRARNGVGIGTNDPLTQLHVRDRTALTFNADLDRHVALIEDIRTGTVSNVLALKTGINNPSVTTNFITFFDGDNDALGGIEGNGGGGVVFNSGGADFAEWLPKRNPEEVIGPGDVIGWHPDGISLETAGALRVMAVSTRPIVVGNSPAEDELKDWVQAGFIGQVPVRVLGAVNAGDWIIASGLEDGTGRAVAADAIHAIHWDRIIGQALESVNEGGQQLVNTAIGLGLHSAIGQNMAQLQAENARLTEKNQELEARLQWVEQSAEQQAEMQQRLVALEAMLLAEHVAKQ